MRGVLYCYFSGVVILKIFKLSLHFISYFVSTFLRGVFPAMKSPC
jgi:hypothetical protein